MPPSPSHLPPHFPAGSAQLALALLDLLTSSHASALSKAAFDATITVCSTQYLAGEAVRVYRLLPHFGFAPDVHTCNMTITACSQGGDVQGVLEILGDMQRQGITLNDFTALMALQACMYKRKGRHQVSVQAGGAVQKGAYRRAGGG